MSILSVEKTSGEALLQNMSARPRTSVTRTVPATRMSWVAFGPVHHIPRLTATLRRKLDEEWRSLALTGAFIVHLISAIRCDGLHIVTCSDDHLILNVLLRTRGSLLLAGTPLLSETGGLANSTILCDDPRLVEVVR